MIIKVKYFLIILLVFSQFSCNDWLDLLPPSGLIREEFWQAKEDVEAVLMASYESFANLDYQLFLYGELRGDLLEGDNNQNQSEQNIMESNIYPDNNLCNWKDFYNVINSCNEVIKNAPEVLEVDNTFNEFQMNVWISEAYFMRSLAFFYLVRVFKDIPFVVEPSESDNVDFFLPKSTEEEVLNQIVSDLEANREFAPSGGFPTIGENKGRASKAAFDALLADIELWRFNYEKALTHIKKIEQNEQYELLPGSKWFEIFYPGNSLEGLCHGGVFCGACGLFAGFGFLDLDTPDNFIDNCHIGHIFCGYFVCPSDSWYYGIGATLPYRESFARGSSSIRRICFS